MSTPRLNHVGKSAIEKNQYKRLLDLPLALDPTYMERETTSTNTVSEEENNKPRSEHELKPYKKEATIKIKDLLISILVSIVSACIILGAITLNREAGILGEKTSNIQEEVKSVKESIIKISERVNDLIINVEVIKKSRK